MRHDLNLLLRNDLLSFAMGAFWVLNAQRLPVYRYLEVPGIHVGRALARRLAARRETGTQDTIVLPRETEFNSPQSRYPAP